MPRAATPPNARRIGGWVSWAWELLVRVDRRKQLVDVAVSLDDVDYLKTFVDIAEEDDVSLERRAADIGTQFRPCSAEGAGEVGQCPAFLPEFPDKATADDQAR